MSRSALGTIEATTADWPGWARGIELCGEHGSIAYEDDRIVKWEFRERRPEDELVRAGGDDARASGAKDPAAIPIEGHRRQLEN